MDADILEVVIPMRDEMKVLRATLRLELQQGIPSWLIRAVAGAVDELTRRMGSSTHIGREPDEYNDLAAVARARTLVEVIRSYRASVTPVRRTLG